MPRLYLAQRVWEDVDGIGKCWNVPFHANARGAVNLRSNSEKAERGPTPQGYEIVVYEAEQAAHDNLLLDFGGWNPERLITSRERDAIETFTGKRVGADMPFLSVVEQLLTDAAMYDPSGVNGWKPLRTSRRHGTRLKVGGLGDVIRRPFSENDLAYQAAVAVFRADYRRLKANGAPLRLLNRFTGKTMLILEGRASDSLAIDMLPDEHEGDGWEHPSTTITDDFTDTNGTALTSHNDSGGNAWVNFEGSALFDIQSNQVAYDNNTGADSSHQGSALSGPDHTVQVEIHTLSESVNAKLMGLWWRNPGDGSVTGYSAWLRQATGDTPNEFEHAMFEVTTGTFSQFGSSPVSDTFNSGALLQHNHNSSDLITGTYDGVDNYSETDTTHTSGNYGGLRADAINTGDSIAGDNYQAEDDAASVTTRRYRLSLVGVG